MKKLLIALTLLPTMASLGIVFASPLTMSNRGTQRPQTAS